MHRRSLLADTFDLPADSSYNGVVGKSVVHGGKNKSDGYRPEQQKSRSCDQEFARASST